MALEIGGVSIAAPSAAADPNAVLVELGTKFNLNNKTVAFIDDTLKLTSLADFFYLFTSDQHGVPQQVDTDFVDMIEGLENKGLEASRVRQAWIGIRDAMRGADALKVEEGEQCDMDALLPRTDLDWLYNNFWARHKIDFAADADPADALVSRRFKEISRRLLTVPNPFEAKTLAQQLQATKKNQTFQAHHGHWRRKSKR